MKRILGVMLAAAVFCGLVYAVLVVARVSEPAATTVHGLTMRRLWATTAAFLALAGVVSGGLSVARPSRFGSSVLAVVAGLVAAIGGWLNLATANGGPGTGNGVVGGAAAVVLGLVGLALGGLALARRFRAGAAA